MSQHGRPRVSWETLTLKLRNPFRVSYGVSETRQAFILRLAGDEGLGEGTIPPYYRVDPTAMTTCWQRAAESDAPFPNEIAAVERWIPDGPPPARSAIDLALHDRIARRQGVPLYRLLDLPKPPALATSFTIGIDAPEAMAEMARQIADYPVIKIKLGTDDDESRVRAIREARPDAKLRVDANAGWTVEQSIQHLRWLEKYDLELIEQPLPKEQIEQMGEVQRHTSIPIVADESVQTLEDVERLGAAGVRGINLKLMKVGGLGPAMRILRRARELNLKVMLGCMIETSLGTTAMAHLAGLADWVDLDAPLLISNDPFAGVTYDRHARLGVPERPGIGAELKAAAEMTESRPATL
jgi:L-alanine-DL-glutamate epimerase-like enolase superfamily enzyme